MARHFSWSRIGDLTLELYRDSSRAPRLLKNKVKLELETA
jgi:hypothetical protein